MEIESVNLYKSFDQGKHIVVTATITKDGGLNIHDFDGSKEAHERFGGDVEYWLKLDTNSVDILIKKLNKKKESRFNIFNFFYKKQEEHCVVKNRLELLNWIQKEYSGIGAQNELKKLFNEYGVSPSESSWPFG